MSIYHFAIHQDVPIETAWEELEIAGIEVLYSDENPDGEEKVIICRLPLESSKEDWLAKLTSVQAIKPAQDLSIDWDAQWSTHGHDFHEGFVHVRVGGLEFILKPGPGFGDASHASTRLVLHLMEGTIQKRPVLDIGCGSGILTIAAAKLGASPLYAVDIDPDAIRHTIENIALNNLEAALWVGSAEELVEQKPKKKLIALMNMISSEQHQAWKSLEPLHDHIEECITSGVLEEEKGAYLAGWKADGWKVESSLQEGDWLAFHFVKVAKLA